MQITDQNFTEEVKNFNGVALVDFFAEWCGPCRTMAPVIEDLAKEYKDNAKVKIGKLNVDENQASAQEFNVMSIPTILLFKNGIKVKETVGVKSKDDLKKLIEENL